MEQSVNIIKVIVLTLVVVSLGATSYLFWLTLKNNSLL